jgi:hypothetical protein
MVYEVTTPEGKCFGRALQKISTRRAHAVWASLVLYAGFAVLLCCPPQVPRFVLGLSIMLKALFFILVLCVLVFGSSNGCSDPRNPRQASATNHLKVQPRKRFAPLAPVGETRRKSEAVTPQWTLAVSPLPIERIPRHAFPSLLLLPIYKPWLARYGHLRSPTPQ